MSLQLPTDPGTRWTRTAEPWVVGPLFYPLELVEVIILIMELVAEILGRKNFNRKFF
jgi:hypothetical protein